MLRTLHAEPLNWTEATRGRILHLANSPQCADRPMRLCTHFSSALELNPNFAAAHGFLGYALALDGQFEPAVEHLNQALSLSPHDPQNIVFMIGLGQAYYQAGRYNEAVKYSQNIAQQRPEHFGAHRQLCASLAQAGRMEEARATLERLKQLQPNVSLAWVNENLPLTSQAMKKYLDGFRKAGLE